MQFSSTEFFQKKKKAKSSKHVKRCFTKLLFCKFTEKRETRRNGKHRGTFLIFGRTNKQGTQFLFKKKRQLQKETCFFEKHCCFVKKGENEKGKFKKKTEFLLLKKKRKTIRKKR